MDELGVSEAVLDTEGDAVLLTLPVWLAVCVADTLAVDEGEGTK